MPAAISLVWSERIISPRAKRVSPVWAIIIGWTSPLACIVSVALARARLMASWQGGWVSGGGPACVSRAQRQAAAHLAFFATRVSGISVNSPGLYSRWCGLPPRRHARPLMCDMSRITVLLAIWKHYYGKLPRNRAVTEKLHCGWGNVTFTTTRTLY